MKKTWEDAAIEVLDITATAGGPIKDNKVDGDIYWNESQNSWAVNVGCSEESAS